MSFNTLLEAVEYIRRQEEEELNRVKQQAALNTGLTKIVSGHPVVTRTVFPTPIPNITKLNQPALLITTPHLSGTPGPSVIHAPAATSQSDASTSSTKKAETQNRARFINNSFDIINPLYIDEKNNVAKRKQPPMVFRAGTREVHNKLEKHRRAHLKECFDELHKQIHTKTEEKKISNLNILHSAMSTIRELKKKERVQEREMEVLAGDKMKLQTKISNVRKELSLYYDNAYLNSLQASAVPASRENSRRSTENEVEMRDDNSRTDSIEDMPHSSTNTNGVKKVSILPSKSQDVQPVQTALSVVPVSYPINQGLVLQKLAIVPKGITDLTPLVPTFITQQGLNGKVVPLVNAQYVMGKCPLVVVSTANPRPS